MAAKKTRMDWAILPQPVAEVRQVSPKYNCKTKMENRETVEHSVKKGRRGGVVSINPMPLAQATVQK